LAALLDGSLEMAVCNFAERPDVYFGIIVEEDGIFLIQHLGADGGGKSI
jgi:hypothetical protein